MRFSILKDGFNSRRDRKNSTIVCVLLFIFKSNDVSCVFERLFMNKFESTFDTLVKTLSTSEAQKMLDSIKDNISASTYTFESTSGYKLDMVQGSNLAKTSVAQENVFVRFILRIIAFFRSSPIQVIHNEYVLKQLAAELRRIARLYYVPSQNIFTQQFYQALKELRKTQLFFSGLLQAYDSSKGEFYIILSSFIAPTIYDSLLTKTDPFLGSFDNESAMAKAHYIRELDVVLNQLSESQKSDIYTCAKAIEWIKNLCDASVDKALTRFAGPEGSETCVANTILSEMQILASVLNSVRKIPDEVLQTLFLLYEQENIATSSTDLETEIEKFKTDAIDSLRSISQFISVIPMVPILRYVSKDMSWQPLKIEAGEDWFVFFKHAWKERLNVKWDEFINNQEKIKLRTQMLSLLELDDLLPLSFEPWTLVPCNYVFSRQLSFEFLKTFFLRLYGPYLSQLFNVILVNGKFVRRENSTEFIETFSQFQQFGDFIHSFEFMLGPEGEIGSSFEKLKNEKLVGLTYKKNLDTLLKSIDVNAKQIITNVTKAVRSMYAILTGIFTGGKKGIYASLTNIDTINGNKTEEYLEKLKKVYEQMASMLNILERLEKIEI